LASGGGSVALADQSNADTDVILYDIATGEVLNRYRGHTGNVTALAFHPTENVLVSTSRDTTVRVWSLESLQEIDLLDAHTSTVYDLAFSADGTRLVTAGDFSVRLWDYPSSEQILTLEDFGAQIAALSVAIHPDGTQIAAGFNNGTASIWSAETGELIRRINAHTDDVVSIAFDSTGTQLITASNDRSIGLWDVDTGDNVVRLRGHEGAVTDAVLSPDGTTILSASEDNTLRLWDIATGEVIRIFAQHNASVLDIATFSDGNLAYSASADGSVIGWRISLDAVLAWVDENRYTRDITPEELNTIRPVTDE
ncbi:MAG: WD40 repeat domain-containing protein, partial [Chloroflexota bacterium]